MLGFHVYLLLKWQDFPEILDFECLFISVNAVHRSDGLVTYANSQE